MNTKNAAVSVVSVTVAAGAILTGAFLSNRAVADTAPTPKVVLTMVGSNGDSKPVMCRFDDLELPPLAKERTAPAWGVAPTGANASGIGVAGSARGPQPVIGATLRVIGEGAVTISGEPGIAGGEGVGTPPLVFTPQDARLGSAAECEELRRSMPIPVLPTTLESPVGAQAANSAPSSESGSVATEG